MKPAMTGTIQYGARIQTVDTEAGRYVTRASCGYTPREIAEAMHKLGLDQAQVVGPTGREGWECSAGERLARHVGY